MNVVLSLLAQTSQPTGATPSPQSNPLTTFLPLMLMIGVFWWIMMRGGRKQRKQTEDMLKSMKRNDRVQTIGGIIGTIVEVREQEVVLKVDETSNVKMRFNRSAIKEVLQDQSVDNSGK